MLSDPPAADLIWAHPGPRADEIPAQGCIDIHAHLIPGIDDGCQIIEESIASVKTLLERGYIGTLCTPHYWPTLFPHITPPHIDAWVEQLRAALTQEGITYHLWPGAEVRLHQGIIDCFERDGVPALAHSRYVLCDLWEDKWPDYLHPALDYLFDRQFQPVIAHPERMACIQTNPRHVDELLQRGVLLQGNLRCLTGGEGPRPDAMVRALLQADRYAFLALDLHKPDTLIERLEGRDFVRDEFGADQLLRLTSTAPRERLLRG
jgi:protein-tyrosine phosphatase